MRRQMRGLSGPCAEFRAPMNGTGVPHGPGRSVPGTAGYDRITRMEVVFRIGPDAHASMFKESR